MYAAAIGTWNSNDEKCLLAGASHADTEIDFVSIEDAASRIEAHAGGPRCVFVAHDANVGALVGRMRERASLLSVPVIAVVPHPSEAFYRNAFASGADDALVSGDRGGVTRRLANLLACKPTSAATSTRKEGLALVAVSDLGLRRSLGKTLRRAGFDVGYASDARDLVDMAWQAPSLSLVVAAEGFPPFGADAAIRSVRTAARNQALPALVIPADASETFDLTKAGTFDAASKVLNFAEEVVRGDGTELRASKRLQHSTICTFRAAGSLHPTYGLTHNVSREGLFVRTLDAPVQGTEVWIELRAPESAHTVHLRGEAVWRREPTSIGATPFGFGMKLNPALCPPSDLAAYTRGYELLRANASGN